MKAAFLSSAYLMPALLLGQSAVNLPDVTVYSTRVANQAPAGTFAMPVSALRFEPQADIHSRNLAEAQADITIRGGIFENTGFQLGAVTTGDPQTGHYFAEIPVAPAMLSTPRIVTGADLALGAMNATSGAIVYGWRPIRSAGLITAGAGEHGFFRGEVYEAVTWRRGAGELGADIDIAHSESDGAVAFGEHEFDRIAGRLQFVRGKGQTDLFAGYQAKRFGWPNLYTPFNSNETENLQTTLFALNHRVDLSGGDFFTAGVFHRRNKDDYAFNRFAPLGPIHPFQHTTRVTGAAIEARKDFGQFILNTRGEASGDELESSSLTFGRFNSRNFFRISAVPEKSWTHGDRSQTTLKLGASFDDTNRDRSAVSPVAELARTLVGSPVRRIFASYAELTQLPTYTALNSSATAGLFRGNPNLGRQTTHNFEAGMSAEFAGWTTDAAVFWRRDEALVDWTFERGVTARTANAVDVDVGGVELVLRRSWPGGDVVLGYTGLTKDADYRDARVDASFYALNYAKHRLTAAVTMRLGHGFELRVDNVARIQAENMLRVVGGDEALITSLALVYRPISWPGIELSAQVDNLWDSDFQDVPAVPAAGRQAAVGLSYAW